MKSNRTARIYRIFEIMWLAIVAVSVVEVYVSFSEEAWNRVIIFTFFIGFGIFRYWWSRRQRLRMKGKD